MPITTITAIMPTAAPALKIPVITEQLLRAHMATNNDNNDNFFMVGYDEFLFTNPYKNRT
jgi:hypothetical protein